MNAPAKFFEYDPEQQIIHLTESNRQLREELDAVKLENKRLDMENGRVREDVYKLEKWRDDRITTLTTALAAAKEALEEDAMWAFDNDNPPLTMKCTYSTGGDLTNGPNNCKAFSVKRKNALALIAASEKE